MRQRSRGETSPICAPLPIDHNCPHVRFSSRPSVCGQDGGSFEASPHRRWGCRHGCGMMSSTLDMLWHSGAVDPAPVLSQADRMSCTSCRVSAGRGGPCPPPPRLRRRVASSCGRQSVAAPAGMASSSLGSCSAPAACDPAAAESLELVPHRWLVHLDIATGCASLVIVHAVTLERLGVQSTEWKIV